MKFVNDASKISLSNYFLEVDAPQEQVSSKEEVIRQERVLCP